MCNVKKDDIYGGTPGHNYVVTAVVAYNFVTPFLYVLLDFIKALNKTYLDIMKEF
jgi:hypothetical protein